MAADFRNQHIRLPGGPRAPALIQVAAYLQDPIGYLERCRERYGPVFTLRWPGMPPMVYFTESAAIREIFRAPPDELCGGQSNAVLDFIAGPRSVARLDGQAHKRRRRGMTTPFTRLGPQYAEVMAANTMRAFADSEGQIISFRDASQSLSLRNLIRCALGVHEPQRAERLHHLMLEFMSRSLNPVMASLWMLCSGVELREFMVRYLAPLASRSWGRHVPFAALAATITELDEFLYAAIEEVQRHTHDERRIDVLSLLAQTSEHMSAGELRDELMAILVAGHETTSTTLDWVIVETCTRPEVAARVRAELDEVVGEGPVTVDALPRLEYLRAVIDECLRLHPPVPAVGRHVARETEIAGIRLPAGVVVSPSIALLHRDPASWTAPLSFQPERFLARDVDRSSLIPFGGGTRTCLGKPFGVFQLRVVLATLLTRFELEPTDWPPTRLVQRGLFTGVSHLIEVRLRRRRPRVSRLTVPSPAEICDDGQACVAS